MKVSYLQTGECLHIARVGPQSQHW